MRQWSPSRQAYWPRAWPPIIIALMLTTLVTWLLSPPGWWGLVVGLVIGATSVQARWMVWRRRHPPVPIWVRARREAPWN